MGISGMIYPLPLKAALVELSVRAAGEVFDAKPAARLNQAVAFHGRDPPPVLAGRCAGDGRVSVGLRS